MTTALRVAGRALCVLVLLGLAAWAALALCFGPLQATGWPKSPQLLAEFQALRGRLTMPAAPPNQELDFNEEP